jgi:putative flavoprotein involved in K+ transport
VWFSFTTSVGQGRGHFLLEDGKCRTILTTLQSLDGFEEPLGPTRPKGVRHGADRQRETWSEARAREESAYGNDTV